MHSKLLNQLKLDLAKLKRLKKELQKDFLFHNFVEEEFCIIIEVNKICIKKLEESHILTFSQKEQNLLLSLPISNLEIIVLTKSLLEET